MTKQMFRNCSVFQELTNMVKRYTAPSTRIFFLTDLKSVSSLQNTPLKITSENQYHLSHPEKSCWTICRWIVRFTVVEGISVVRTPHLLGYIMCSFIQQQSAGAFRKKPLLPHVLRGWFFSRNPKTVIYLIDILMELKRDSCDFIYANVKTG